MSTPDLSEFVALTRGKTRRPCKVGEVIQSLSKGDAAKLDAAINATDGGNISVSAVIEWCKQRGHEVSQNTVVYHRSGKCACHDNA